MTDKAASPELWDVMFAAMARQVNNPDEFGGGVIGKTAAVFAALGIDPDMTLAELRACLTGRDNTDGPVAP